MTATPRACAFCLPRNSLPPLYGVFLRLMREMPLVVERVNHNDPQSIGVDPDQIHQWATFPDGFIVQDTMLSLLSDPGWIEQYFLNQGLLCRWRITPRGRQVFALLSAHDREPIPEPEILTHA